MKCYYIFYITDWMRFVRCLNGDRWKTIHMPTYRTEMCIASGLKTLACPPRRHVSITNTCDCCRVIFAGLCKLGWPVVGIHSTCHLLCIMHNYGTFMYIPCYQQDSIKYRAISTWLCLTAQTQRNQPVLPCWNTTQVRFCVSQSLL